MTKIKYMGYLITPARPTGGKAGKGNNKTSSIQVYNPHNHTVPKFYRYKVGDTQSLRIAVDKCRTWIEDHPQEGISLEQYIHRTGASLPALEVFWTERDFDEFRLYNARKFSTAHISKENQAYLWYQITGKRPS